MFTGTFIPNNLQDFQRSFFKVLPTLKKICIFKITFENALSWFTTAKQETGSSDVIQGTRSPQEYIFHTMFTSYNENQAAISRFILLHKVFNQQKFLSMSTCESDAELSSDPDDCKDNFTPRYVRGRGAIVKVKVMKWHMQVNHQPTKIV